MARVFSKLRAVAVGSLVISSVIHTVFNYVANPFICQGPSMYPTLQDDDIILCDKFRTIVKPAPYVRGQVTVSISAQNPNLTVCKRIVAIGGDLVISDNCRITVVPKGHVWLEGDNRRDSNDSRHYGPVNEALILGRVVAIMWPPSRMRLVPQPEVSSDFVHFYAPKNH